MKYTLLTFLSLTGCTHHKTDIEQSVESDQLELLSEDDIEDLPESEIGDDEKDPEGK